MLQQFHLFEDGVNCAAKKHAAANGTEVQSKEVEAKTFAVGAEEGVSTLRPLRLKGAQPTIAELKELIHSALRDSAKVFPRNVRRLSDHGELCAKGDFPSTIATFKSIPNHEFAVKPVALVDSRGKVTEVFAALQLSVWKSERKGRDVNNKRAKCVSVLGMWATYMRDMLGDLDAKGPPLSDLFEVREGVGAMPGLAVGINVKFDAEPAPASLQEMTELVKQIVGGWSSDADELAKVLNGMGSLGAEVAKPNILSDPRMGVREHVLSDVNYKSRTNGVPILQTRQNQLKGICQDGHGPAFTDQMVYLKQRSDAVAAASELTDFTLDLFETTEKTPLVVNAAQRKIATKALQEDLANQRKGLVMGNDVA